VNLTAEQMQIASMIDTKVQALSGAGCDDPQRAAAHGRLVENARIRSCVNPRDTGYGKLIKLIP
jgi:hypothetical protein